MEEGWLSTEQAAALWAAVVGPSRVFRPMSGQTMRKLCRSGVLEGYGVRVMHGGGRFYFVRRDDLLQCLAKTCADAAARAERESAPPPGG